MSDELGRVRPEPRKKILPDGVLRAKDNAVDFHSRGKTQREEAESNMGYFMVELNHRNSELEDEVEYLNKELAQTRKQVRQLDFEVRARAEDAAFSNRQLQRVIGEVTRLKAEKAEQKRQLATETRGKIRMRNVAFVLGVALLAVIALLFFIR